jgi:hypothetical protein
MNRRQMSELLDEHLRSVNVYFDRESEFPKGRGPLKTYIVEAHTPDGACLRDGEPSDLIHRLSKDIGMRVNKTDDKNLYEVLSDSAGFFFDVLDPRFWVVHTMSNVDVAEQVLTTLINKYPFLDYAWPSADLMRTLQTSGKSLGFTIDFDETRLSSSGIAEEELLHEPDAVVKIRFGGTGAEALVQKLNEVVPNAMAFAMVKFSRDEPGTGSYIISKLDQRGRLKAAGNSVSLHLQTVSEFLHEYKSFIMAIERVAKIYSNQTGELIGTPIVLEFPTPLRDFKGFVKALVSCKEPLKIWGLVNPIREDFVQIDGVDLHSGSRLRMDVTTTYLRIYLGPNSCGNTVARLLRNLQAHISSVVSLHLPESEPTELAS